MRTLKLKVSTERVRELREQRQADGARRCEEHNRAQRKAAQVARQQAYVRLERHLLVTYPAVFNLGPPVLPLVMGVREQLAKELPEGITGVTLTKWLQHWCRTPSYLTAVAAEGSMRHDLTGEPVEAVSVEHRAAAVLDLERGHVAPELLGEARKKARKKAAKAPTDEQSVGERANTLKEQA